MNLVQHYQQFSTDENPDAALEKACEDVLILAFRLYGEDPNTFAPETREVMERLNPALLEYLQNW